MKRQNRRSSSVWSAGMPRLAANTTTQTQGPASCWPSLRLARLVSRGHVSAHYPSSLLPSSLETKTTLRPSLESRCSLFDCRATKLSRLSVWLLVALLQTIKRIAHHRISSETCWRHYITKRAICQTSAPTGELNRDLACSESRRRQPPQRRLSRWATSTAHTRLR